MIQLVLLLLSGCGKQGGSVVEEELVVEGWIDAGGYPVVIVSTTVVPDGRTHDMEDLRRHIARWARVTVDDGESQVVLVGHIDENQFPSYTYTTAWMKGVPGRTYSLTVEYAGYKAFARTTIPFEVPDVSVSAVPQDASGQTYDIEARFAAARPGVFYRFFMKAEDEDTSFIPVFPGVFDGSEIFEGKKVTLNKGLSFSRRSYQPVFHSGEQLRLKVCTMDEASWQYWKDYEEISALASSPIFPVRYNLTSNVSGALGYWAGYNASYQQIELP